MKNLGRFSWILVAVFAAWVASSLVPRPARSGFAATEFGALPVVFNGRLQPMDSLGRNSLIQLRGRQSANVEPWKGAFERPRVLSASEWLMAVMLKPEEADAWKVFRIDHPDLKGLLKLPLDPDPLREDDGKHYSWRQIAGDESFQAVEKAAREAREKSASVRTTFDQAVLRLHHAMTLYFRLKNTLMPQDSVDLMKEIAGLEVVLPAGGPARKHLAEAISAYREFKQLQRSRRMRDPESGRARVAETFQRLIGSGATLPSGGAFDREAMMALLPVMEKYMVLEELEPPLVVPPPDADHSRDLWMRTGTAILGVMGGAALPESVGRYAALAVSYRKGDVAGFKEGVTGLRELFEKRGWMGELRKASAEQRFNQVAPFYKMMVLYVVAFLLAVAFWFTFADWARRAAFLLIGFGFVVHSGGLLMRMWLEGRPPVTNLYSSAIFIGWGAVALGMILERFWRNSIGLVVASGLGFITLIIAHNLALDGDTLQMMQAVLDTNFWLATHVVTVTLGYSSTFVAGFLAMIYILRGVFTAGLDAATGRSLVRMVYGIVCFATLFSFVGTVLGGIWADQSWGRFWGWDPKENGALIIVLWNALILHARWGGLVKERGTMNLAIGGNIMTAWSWFGTNMLGVGLHSYGSTSAAFYWLGGFVLSQLALIACGSMPFASWKSAARLVPELARKRSSAAAAA